MPFPPNPDDHDTKLFMDVPTFYTGPHPDVLAARSSISHLRQGLEASTLDQQQKIVRSRWDWDRLEAYNAEWKSKIDHLNEQGSSDDLKRFQGATWYYMDIWDMAIQRPDAHTQNLVDPVRENYDCLHCEHSPAQS